MGGPEIERLIQLLARLPGLGPRSARRAALHLMKRRDSLLGPLARATAAFTWSPSHGQGTKALRPAGAPGRFWEVRGHLRAGRARLEAARALRSMSWFVSVTSI